MNERGNLLIILVLIITVLLVGIGIYNLRYSKQENTTNIKQAERVISTPEPCDLSSIKSAKNNDRTTTLINEKNNYQITYPSVLEWKSRGNDCTESIEISSADYPLKIQQISFSQDKTDVYNNEYNTYEELVNNYALARGTLNHFTEKRTVINGYTAKRFSEYVLTGEEFYGQAHKDLPYGAITYVIAKETGVYFIQVRFEGNNYLQLMAEADKITNTFK